MPPQTRRKFAGNECGFQERDRHNLPTVLAAREAMRYMERSPARLAPLLGL